MTYRPPNPAFAAHHTDYRMTDPEQIAEARVLDELAALTERHGPWDAALVMFGTDYAEVAA